MRIQRLEYIVHEGSHMRVVATRVMLNSTLESALVPGGPEVVSVKWTATDGSSDGEANRSKHRKRDDARHTHSTHLAT